VLINPQIRSSKRWLRFNFASGIHNHTVPPTGRSAALAADAESYDQQNAARLGRADNPGGSGSPAGCEVWHILAMVLSGSCWGCSVRNPFHIYWFVTGNAVSQTNS